MHATGRGLRVIIASLARTRYTVAVAHARSLKPDTSSELHIGTRQRVATHALGPAGSNQNSQLASDGWERKMACVDSRCTHSVPRETAPLKRRSRKLFGSTCRCNETHCNTAR